MPENSDNSDDLQFEHAESDVGASESLVCALSGEPIDGEYFLANGEPVSAASKAQLEGDLGDASGGGGRFAKAVVFGAIAAAIGAGIYFAVTYFTGYELGLIAIVVGFLVGKAVSIGSNGRGGLKYQLVAVGFTYLAIVSSYVPMVIMELADDPEYAESGESQATTGAASAGAEAAEEQGSDSAPQAALSADEASDEPLGIVGALTLIGLLLALPFLAGFENIIGLVIIGIGLWQAWKMNARAEIVFEGPYQTGAV